MPRPPPSPGTEAAPTPSTRLVAVQGDSFPAAVARVTIAATAEVISCDSIDPEVLGNKSLCTDATRETAITDCWRGSRKSRQSIFSKRSMFLRGLPSTIDPTLLRAAGVEKVLDGFGEVFRSKAGSAADYELSEPVEEIDDFLSHDWDTARWQKTTSLCLLYNMRAAFITSCCVGLPVAILGI
eukprot:TRINITY_DN35890_c0_g1_i3.p1 TRINITY_DN35890_c0_g1~~TRINITY_DN35890_c0_g1_i3.p1  ORF type:complete len:183 (+),score=24.56 TRINITY_DN35890_c0_g1_i3:164-712(+)